MILMSFVFSYDHVKIINRIKIALSMDLSELKGLLQSNCSDNSRRWIFQWSLLLTKFGFCLRFCFECSEIFWTSNQNFGTRPNKFKLKHALTLLTKVFPLISKLPGKHLPAAALGNGSKLTNPPPPLTRITSSHVRILLVSLLLTLNIFHTYF